MNTPTAAWVRCCPSNFGDEVYVIRDIKRKLFKDLDEAMAWRVTQAEQAETGGDEGPDTQGGSGDESAEGAESGGGDEHDDEAASGGNGSDDA